jgi:hypothetical protein
MAVYGSHRAFSVLAVLLLTVTLAACSSDDDEGDDPTATAVPPTVTATVTQLPPTLSAGNGNVISDGVCEVLIPEGWVDDGTGKGATASGHVFILFGGSVRSDAEWATSVDLVATPTAGLTIESIEETADSIYVTYANDRGFEFRKRFGVRYCDFQVTSRGGPISEDEQSYWPAVTQSLAPVSQ